MNSFFIACGDKHIQCKACAAQEKEDKVLKRKGRLAVRTNMDNKRKHVLHCVNVETDLKQGIAEKLALRGQQGNLFLSKKDIKQLQKIASLSRRVPNKIKLNQSTIEGLPNILDRKEPDKLNEKLAEMILSLGLPFSLVEKSEFREFVHSIAPAYASQMSHRKQLLTYVERVTKKVDEKVEKYLKGKYVTCDVDGYEQVTRNQVKQLTLTDEDGFAFSYGFDDGVFEDADAYAEVLERTITELAEKNIEVRAVGSDNASVMVKARSIVKSNHPRISTVACSFHSIDLLANLNELNDCQKDILDDCQTFLMLFRKRSLFKHLNVLRVEHNKGGSRKFIQTLKRSGDTRKLSRYNMLQSIIDNMKLVRVLLLEPHFISAVEKCRVKDLYEEVTAIVQNKNGRLEAIEGLCDLYQILHRTQRQLESNDCDLSRMYTLLLLLVDKVKKSASIEEKLRKRIAREAKEKLAKYIDVETILSVALDPRRHSHTTKQSGKWSIDLDSLPVMVKSKYTQGKFQDVMMSALHEFLTKQKFSPKERAKILKQWDRLFYHDIDTQEVVQYDYEYSPVEYWKYFLRPQSHLQTLAEEVAIPLLSLKASSAVVERVNSANKFVQSLSRNRLTPQMCNACVKVYVNNKTLRNIEEGKKRQNKPLPTIDDLDEESENEVDTYDDFNLTEPKCLELEVEDNLQNEFFENLSENEFPDLEEEEFPDLYCNLLRRHRKSSLQLVLSLTQVTFFVLGLVLILSLT